MLQAKCRVLANSLICGNFFKLVLQNKSIAAQAKPGQFINIRVDKGQDLLLRRPLSIYLAKDDKLEIIYKVVGRGTDKLAQVKEQEKLDVIGPLGNGYTLTAGKALLVGGGTGIASLVFLAAALKTKFNSVPTVLIGAKSKEDLLCFTALEKIGCAVKAATADGSVGFHGLVTELFREIVAIFSTHPSMVYACGPRPMLRELVRLCRHFRIPCEISLEEHLGCGVGACLGCVVKGAKNEYLRVCKEGPVFKASEVIL
ncbi:MAG: dihydroorotate dehydrogenase electron transfer subunit [Elusimicrobia bacterium]|nr:dihydroorotate dehydrogenase electron transfer subunit [Elusimicrobiota bacterium]